MRSRNLFFLIAGKQNHPIEDADEDHDEVGIHDVGAIQSQIVIGVPPIQNPFHIEAIRRNADEHHDAEYAAINEVVNQISFRDKKEEDEEQNPKEPDHAQDAPPYECGNIQILFAEIANQEENTKRQGGNSRRFGDDAKVNAKNKEGGEEDAHEGREKNEMGPDGAFSLG